MFLRDLTDVTLGDDVDETEYEKFKLKIMSIVDDNHNGKLEAKELVGTSCYYKIGVSPECVLLDCTIYAAR